MSNPLDRLKHHVSGAIERGEKEAIVEQPKSSLPDDVRMFLERMNGHLAATQHDNEATRQMRRWAHELLAKYGEP